MHSLPIQIKVIRTPLESKDIYEWITIQGRRRRRRTLMVSLSLLSRVVYLYHRPLLLHLYIYRLIEWCLAQKRLKIRLHIQRKWHHQIRKRRRSWLSAAMESRSCTMKPKLREDKKTLPFGWTLIFRLDQRSFFILFWLMALGAQLGVTQTISQVAKSWASSLRAERGHVNWITVPAAVLRA